MVVYRVQEVLVDDQAVKRRSPVGIYYTTTKAVDSLWRRFSLTEIVGSNGD